MYLVCSRIRLVKFGIESTYHCGLGLCLEALMELRAS